MAFGLATMFPRQCLFAVALATSVSLGVAEDEGFVLGGERVDWLGEMTWALFPLTFLFGCFSMRMLWSFCAYMHGWGNRGRPAKPEVEETLEVSPAPFDWVINELVDAGGEASIGDLLNDLDGGPSPWEEQWDESHQASYFWNTETNETSWERPEGFRGRVPSAQMDPLGFVDEGSVLGRHSDRMSSDAFESEQGLDAYQPSGKYHAQGSFRDLMHKHTGLGSGLKHEGYLSDSDGSDEEGSNKERVGLLGERGGFRRRVRDGKFSAMLSAVKLDRGSFGKSGFGQSSSWAKSSSERDPLSEASGQQDDVRNLVASFLLSPVQEQALEVEEPPDLEEPPEEPQFEAFEDQGDEVLAAQGDDNSGAQGVFVAQDEGIRFVGEAQVEAEADTAEEGLDDAEDWCHGILMHSYGLLGERLLYDDETLVPHAGPDPADKAEFPLGCCVVDPTSVPLVQPPGKPGDAVAGGRSAELYKFLGIYKDAKFGLSVTKHLKETGDAKHVQYKVPKTANSKLSAFNKETKAAHVIHAVAPDFRTLNYAAPGGELETLAQAYHGILLEFLSSGCVELRLVPLCDGVLAGPHLPANRVPALTWAALQKAFLLLDEKQRSKLLDEKGAGFHGRLRVRMMIQAVNQVPSYEAAGFTLAEPLPPKPAEEAFEAFDDQEGGQGLMLGGVDSGSKVPHTLQVKESSIRLEGPTGKDEEDDDDGDDDGEEGKDEFELFEDQETKALRRASRRASVDAAAVAFAEAQSQAMALDEEAEAAQAELDALRLKIKIKAEERASKVSVSSFEEGKGGGKGGKEGGDSSSDDSSDSDDESKASEAVNRTSAAAAAAKRRVASISEDMEGRVVSDSDDSDDDDDDQGGGQGGGQGQGAASRRDFDILEDDGTEVLAVEKADRFGLFEGGVTFDRLARGELIGEGTFGKVFEGTYFGSAVAVKDVSKVRQTHENKPTTKTTNPVF